MERTASDEIRPRLLEPYITVDQIDDVDSIEQLLDK